MASEVEKYSLEGRRGSIPQCQGHHSSLSLVTEAGAIRQPISPTKAKVQTVRN
jgi:hypothetical protein